METVFPSVWVLVAAAAILFVSQVVYVTLGFGAGLVAVGGLSLVLPEVQDAVVLLLLVNLPAEIAIVSTSFRRVQWRRLGWVVAGIVVGIPLGGVLLRHGETHWLLTGLGVVLVITGLVFLRLPAGPALRAPGFAGAPVGLVSGVLTGLFGTGGPPLIVWYRLHGLDKTAFRGTLMGLFLAMTAIRVPSYLALGLVTGPRLWSSLVVLPAILAGGWCGHHLHVRLDEASYRRLVAVGLAILGVVLLTRP